MGILKALFGSKYHIEGDGINSPIIPKVIGDYEIDFSRIADSDSMHLTFMKNKKDICDGEVIGFAGDYVLIGNAFHKEKECLVFFPAEKGILIKDIEGAIEKSVVYPEGKAVAIVDDNYVIFTREKVSSGKFDYYDADEDARVFNDEICAYLNADFPDWKTVELNCLNLKTFEKWKKKVKLQIDVENDDYTNDDATLKYEKSSLVIIEPGTNREIVFPITDKNN